MELDTRTRPAPVGVLLREWRAARRLSQLDLSLDAGLSTRHLSCIETGKSQPSRDMLGRLADTLDMPLRERNALYVAAGYAPVFPETTLATPEIKRAVDFMLRQQDPYPAFLMNRHWDILAANGGGQRMNRYLLDGRDSRHTNMLHLVFDPEELRPLIANWEELAGDILRHLHKLVATSPSDERARALLDEVLGYPGVPARWRTRELDLAPSPLITTVFNKGGQEIRFFSTITTFGTARDLTLDELHIEASFPLDDATEALCQRLQKLADTGQ